MDEKQILLRRLEHVCTEDAELLREIGVEPNFRNAVLLAHVKKAAKGDATATRYLREILAEEKSSEKGEASAPSTDLSAMTDTELLQMLQDADE